MLKAVFFLPVLPPVVVVAVVWRMLLHPNGIMTWFAGGCSGASPKSAGSPMRCSRRLSMIVGA